YPTAVEFLPLENDTLEREAYARRDPQRPLSLYLHIPFCRHVCYYCGCNKIVTKDMSRAAPYLDYLKAEIRRKHALLASANNGRLAPVE
ncbi:hypothetical protein Q4595_27360, partial [Wenyingzhuangia sp. 1_MG-2023]|nr:hypothetical protein [Wenyingzhuangia sp. 1_MG-2023]